MKHTRILSLLLCAALLCGVLAGCTTTSADSQSASSSASATSDASSAASSSSEDASSNELPGSTTQASTSGLNPVDFDENSVFSISGTSTAFQPCLGWGPGVSGCSLKSVIAAASLLNWAENARLSMRTPEAIEDTFKDWYNDLSAADQDNFAEAWPLIKSDALALLSDKSSMTGRIEDAGLDASTLPGCTLKNWQALQSVLDDCVPDAGEY